MSAEGWAIIISAVALGAVQIITAWRGNVRSDANRAATAAQLAPIATDAKVISAHVNSESARANGEKISLERENLILREIIAKQDADKQLLAAAAQTVATVAASQSPRVESPSVTVAAQRSLANIDVATAETAENTRATDKLVDTLKERGR